MEVRWPIRALRPAPPEEGDLEEFAYQGLPEMQERRRRVVAALGIVLLVAVVAAAAAALVWAAGYFINEQISRMLAG